MKKHLSLIIAAAAIAASQFASAQVKVTGGGPNASDSVTVEILQDITLRVNQGYQISGIYFGFTIPGVFSASDGSFQRTSDIGSATSVLNYQTTSSATPETSFDSALSFAGQFDGQRTLGVIFLTDFTTFQAGGLLTFKAGTLSRRSSLLNANNVLLNPGATYTLTESSFFSDDGEGGAVSLSSSNVTIVPEPSTYALFGLGALALLSAARRKRTA